MVSNFFKNDGLNLDNFKDEYSISKSMIYPSKKYQEFKNKFIKHPQSNGKIFSEIVKDYIL
jgi:hypothetical protein